MSELLYKELRLAAHPSRYVSMCMGALLLVPAYPYSVVFFFGCLGLFQSFMFDRETRDVFYTALLPVRKGDGVRGKILLAVFSQLTQLALSLPFAFLRTLYMAEGNPAGIEATAAYYGFGLMLYGTFNLVFFTRFYRTAYQAGTSFLIAHRLATSRGADRILVLDQGRAAEAGTHRELLAAGGVYAQLYAAQFQP